MSDAESPQRGAILLGLGEAASMAGDERAAAEAYAAARAWFARAGDEIAAGRAARLLGHAHWRQEAIPEARRAFEAALDLLEGHPGPELIRALVDLGSLLGVSLRDTTDGIAHGRWALDWRSGRATDSWKRRRGAPSATCRCGAMTRRPGFRNWSGRWRWRSPPTIRWKQRNAAPARRPRTSGRGRLASRARRRCSG
ncbi:MAG: hypothetical protein U0232_24060 [Thermomicrobiales bacterium]